MEHSHWPGPTWTTQLTEIAGDITIKKMNGPWEGKITAVTQPPAFPGTPHGGAYSHVLSEKGSSERFSDF